MTFYFIKQNDSSTHNQDQLKNVKKNKLFRVDTEYQPIGIFTRDTVRPGKIARADYAKPQLCSFNLNTSRRKCSRLFVTLTSKANLSVCAHIKLTLCTIKMAEIQQLNQRRWEAQLDQLLE